MKCRICKSNCEEIFDAVILNKHRVKYYYCENCGFLFTENPHWLAEAYKESMNFSDTGVLQRNVLFSKYASVLLHFLFDNKAKFLDWAGGFGVFTRLMRDIGFDYYWSDPYTENILARNFEGSETDKYELVTSFESFEHFVDPIYELEKILKVCKNIFFSTETLPNPVPLTADWWYFGLCHGQHLSFYSPKTLKYLAHKYGLRYYSYGSLHLFTNKKINKIRFRLLFKLTEFGLDHFVARRMKSKTISDMQSIVKKLTKRRK
ncbi:MAG: class I SAM-dependent methyltransferase [Candidatus Berkelbacteria bacterium]